MRVWDHTDPRLLNRKHLLSEHLEVHTLLSGGWSNHPESRRFYELGDRGVSLLGLRHELLRVAMFCRWGVRHSRDTHPTPVDLGTLSDRAQGALLLYERHALPVPRVCNAYEMQAFFRRLMRPMNFPPSRLEGGATTPWHRDGIKASEYVSVGDSWTRSHYHHKEK